MQWQYNFFVESTTKNQTHPLHKLYPPGDVRISANSRPSCNCLTPAKKMLQIKESALLQEINVEHVMFRCIFKIPTLFCFDFDFDFDLFYFVCRGVREHSMKIFTVTRLYCGLRQLHNKQITSLALRFSETLLGHTRTLKYHNNVDPAVKRPNAINRYVPTTRGWNGKRRALALPRKLSHACHH